MKCRRGQVALYLVTVLVAIMVLVLMNAGAFLAVRAKNRAMNAGDAAALAAAHRQAELLNEIGRLNLRHAEADAVRDYERSREIVREQKRLALIGPIECLRAAQDAARANGAKDSESMTRILRKHVSTVLGRYKSTPELFPEPWEGAWDEYAAELSSVVAGGICAGPDNIEFIDAVWVFPLYAPVFYNMIFARAWCKIVVNHWEGLLNCDSHNMPHPVYNENDVPVNCEICSLHLELRPLFVSDGEALQKFRETLTLNGANFPPVDEDEAEDDRPSDDPSRYYFFYDRKVWFDGEQTRAWEEMDPGSKYQFPVLAKPKPEFDVLGCSSVFRVIETIPRLLSDTTTTGAWSAAAKPFGTIQTSEGRSIVTHPDAFGLVLPAYEETRLIPLCAAYFGGQEVAGADEDWITHVREHVPQYLAQGVNGLPVCRFCRALTEWEDPAFRQNISEWIDKFGRTCVRPGGSGSMQGGTSYAH